MCMCACMCFAVCELSSVLCSVCVCKCVCGGGQGGERMKKGERGEGEKPYHIAQCLHLNHLDSSLLHHRTVQSLCSSEH